MAINRSTYHSTTGLTFIVATDDVADLATISWIDAAGHAEEVFTIPTIDAFDFGRLLQIATKPQPA